MMQFWNDLYEGALQKVNLKLNIAAHTCNPGIWEVEASLQGQNYPGLCREF